MGLDSSIRRTCSSLSTNDHLIEGGKDVEQSKQHSDTDVELVKGSSEPSNANDVKTGSEERGVEADCHHGYKKCPEEDKPETCDSALFKSKHKESNNIVKVEANLFMKSRPVFIDQLNNLPWTIDTAHCHFSKKAEANSKLQRERENVAHQTTAGKEEFIDPGNPTAAVNDEALLLIIIHKYLKKGTTPQPPKSIQTTISTYEWSCRDGEDASVTNTHSPVPATTTGCTSSESVASAGFQAAGTMGSVEDGSKAALSNTDTEREADSRTDERKGPTASLLVERPSSQERTDASEEHSTTSSGESDGDFHKVSNRRILSTKPAPLDGETGVSKGLLETECTEQSCPSVCTERKVCRDEKSGATTEPHGTASSERRHAGEDKYSVTAVPEHEGPAEEEEGNVEPRAPSTRMSTETNGCREGANATRAHKPVPSKTTRDSSQGIDETVAYHAPEPEAMPDSTAEDSTACNDSKPVHRVEALLINDVTSHAYSETEAYVQTGVTDSTERESSASSNAPTTVLPGSLPRRQEACDKLTKRQCSSRPATHYDCTKDMAPTNTQRETNTRGAYGGCVEPQMPMSESVTNSRRSNSGVSTRNLDLAEESECREESKDSADAKPGSKVSRSVDGYPRQAHAKTFHSEKITSSFHNLNPILLLIMINAETAQKLEVDECNNKSTKEQVNEDELLFITPHDVRRRSGREKNGLALPAVSKMSTEAQQKQDYSEYLESANAKFIVINQHGLVKAICKGVLKCAEGSPKEPIDWNDLRQVPHETCSRHSPSQGGNSKVPCRATSENVHQPPTSSLSASPLQEISSDANTDSDKGDMTTTAMEKLTKTTSSQSMPSQTMTMERNITSDEPQAAKDRKPDSAVNDASLRSGKMSPLMSSGAAPDHAQKQRSRSTKVPVPVTPDADNSRSTCSLEQVPAKEEPENLQPQFDSPGTTRDQTSDPTNSHHSTLSHTGDGGTRGQERSRCTDKRPDHHIATEDGQSASQSVAEKQEVTIPNTPEASRATCPASETDGPGKNASNVPAEKDTTTLSDGLQPSTDRPNEQQSASGESRTNDSNTCSTPFVRAEESLATSDPSGKQSDEKHTVPANEILESRAPSDSRGRHDSGTETADSQSVGLPFDPVSVIERVKASDSDSLRGSLESRRFRQARMKLRFGFFDMTRSEKRIHVPRERDPVFISLSLATVHKSKHSSKRTDKRTQPFSMADMQDIHSRRRKKTEQSSSRVEMRQRFEEKLSKRKQDEDDIDILWQTIHNQGRTFHYVLATLPFFPRDEFPPVRERMRLESMRLASFLNFPIDYPHSTLRLANAGFFFTGQEGILACHFCGVTFSCDRSSGRLDPYALHRERSPDCPFVRGTEIGNLFIQDAQVQASSGRDITGDGSSEPRAHVPQQVQISRAALAPIMADFEAALEAATSPSAATSDTFRLTEPLTASHGDDPPTSRSADSRSNAATGSTDTPLSPGPRTGESGCCLSSNSPLSGPLSNAEQGQTLTRESLSQGQNHGLDHVSSTVTTAPPASEASHASRSQVPVRQPPEVRITTPPENQTRNSTSPQETSHCQQGQGSSSSHLHQNPEENQRSESNTTSAQLSEPRLGATVQVGANGDPVNNSVTPAAVSSPPSSEPVAVSPLLQASHQVPQRSAQAVCTVTVPMPTLRQDNQATPPSASDTAQSASAYDASGAVHRQYTDLQRRERSFLARWPDTHGQSPEELAVAGFFYTGIGDCVRCHYCGLGLKDWDPNDRPIDEHVRWRSSCGYLQALLGRDVIFRTLARIGQSARGDASSRTDTSESVAAGLASQATGVEDHTTTNARADNSSTSREAEVLMTSEPARKARDMGFPDDVIRQSIVALLHTRAGNRAVTVQNVVHTIFYLRERGQERVEGPEPLAPPSDSESDNDEGSATPSTRGGEDSSPQDRASPQSPGPSNHDQTRAVPSAVARVASGQVQHVHFVLEQHGHSNTVLQSSGSSLSSLSSPSSSTISSSRGSASSSSSFSSRSSSSSGDSGYASSSSSSSSSKDESSTGRGAPRASSLFSSGRLPTITEGTEFKAANLVPG